MKRNSLSIIFATILIVTLITLSVIWIINEHSHSYPEPQEAILAHDDDLLLLIPAYKANDRVLFFFIDEENHLGVTYVQEGVFGWKAARINWSQIDIKRSDEKLNGYQRYGENLIYGVIRHGNDRLIQIDEKNAYKLNLESIHSNDVENIQLKGLYLWYFESHTPLNQGTIKLIDEKTGKEIDIIDY